jgi:hypothetical protein
MKNTVYGVGYAIAFWLFLSCVSYYLDVRYFSDIANGDLYPLQWLGRAEDWFPLGIIVAIVGRSLHNRHMAKAGVVSLVGGTITSIWNYNSARDYASWFHVSLLSRNTACAFCETAVACCLLVLGGLFLILFGWRRSKKPMSAPVDGGKGVWPPPPIG